MAWFHKHKWVLVGMTYAPPTDRKFETFSEYTMQVLTLGCTTFVWKCSDLECDSFHKEECLGKQQV